MDREALARDADDFAERFDTHGRGMYLQEWFMLAMARDIPNILTHADIGIALNLGAGRRMIGDSVPLDLEHQWDAEHDEIPCEDSTVSTIWAHGFFEHLTPDRAVFILKECQRVLKTHGVMNIVVPHACSVMQREDITHKSQYTEATWDNLMRNPYYDLSVEPWKLNVVTTFIMGVKWDNLALFTQMVKGA